MTSASFRSYLAVLHDAHGLLRSEERQMGETDAGTVGEVHEAAYLALLVLHQRLISDAVDFAHVRVRVLVRIEYALGGEPRAQLDLMILSDSKHKL